jgi:5'-nucleotidase (lipoprotein e(P4) family)
MKIRKIASPLPSSPSKKVVFSLPLSLGGLRRLVILLAASGLAIACSTAPAPTAKPGASTPPPTVSAPAPAAAPVPADDDLNAVVWTQRAVEHDLVFREIYRSAGEKLLAALADPTWDALPHEDRKGPFAGLPPAVILDVDETVLDNSPYQALLVRTGKEYDEFSWRQWCLKETARPLPGALEFVTLAAQHGVSVFYLTNRAVDLGPATLANLRKAGFPASPGKFLGLGVVVPGCETVGTDKGCRRRLVGRDHRVLMQFGDQVVDFVDVAANTPDGRAKEIGNYAAWIGERWFVLPNPCYGSWEPALFNNDWTRSREKRRRAKIDALTAD